VSVNALSPCPHRPPCPGCPRYGDRSAPASAERELGELAAAAGLAPPTLVRGADLAFRQRARLAVRGRSASPKLGLFQEGTHQIVDIPSCPIHHPRINEVAAALKRGVRASGVAPYADAPHRGDLRYVQIAIERASGQAQLVLVGNAERPDPLDGLAQQLARELGSALHSLWWNGNPERTNRILGPHWLHVSGPPALVEHVNGIAVHFPPGAFAQSHAALAEQLAARVAAWVPAGARVAELYAGCGSLGLGVLAQAASVAFNELEPQALHGLALGLAERPPAEQARARLVPGRAGDAASLVAESDVVIVDPPRRGLDAALLAALCATPPARLVYVSCGLPAFLREARELLAATDLRLRALEIYALFPYTEHVETLALFTRDAVQ